MQKWKFLLLIGVMILGGCLQSQGSSIQPPTQAISPTTMHTKTPTLIPAETATFIPSPTVTPQRTYSCAIRDNEDRMPELHLAEDFATQDWAHFLLSTLPANGQISENPSILVYHVSPYPDTGAYALGAHIQDKPGWEAKTNKTLCVAKISPAEFGLPDKSYAFIVSAVIQDREDNRAILNILMGRKSLQYYYGYGFMPDPGNTLCPMDILSPDWRLGLIAEGAKPGGPDDLRDLAKDQSEQFYVAQGVTRDDVVNLFKEIEADNIFSPRTQQKLNATIFFGGYCRAYENVPR